MSKRAGLSVVLSGQGLVGLVAWGVLVGVIVEGFKWGFLKSDPVVVVIQPAAPEPILATGDPAPVTRAPAAPSDTGRSPDLVQANAALPMPSLPRATESPTETSPETSTETLAPAAQSAPAIPRKNTAWVPEVNLLREEGRQHLVCAENLPLRFSVDKRGSQAADVTRVSAASGAAAPVRMGEVLELSPDCRLRVDATGKALAFFARFTFVERP